MPDHPVLGLVRVTGLDRQHDIEMLVEEFLGHGGKKLRSRALSRFCLLRTVLISSNKRRVSS